MAKRKENPLKNKAAKSTKSLPRKQKKAIKKSLIAKGKETTPQAVQTEYKRQKTNAKKANSAARLYNEKKRFLQEEKIPVSIISKRDSWDTVKSKAKAYKKEQRDKKNAQRFARKVNSLIDAGFSKKEAEKMVGTPGKQKLSFDAVEKAVQDKNSFDDNKQYVTKDYFYVGFADLMGNGMIHDEMSADEALDQINERLSEIGGRISGSPDRLAGVFKVAYGSKDDVDHLAKINYCRSYNFSKKHPKFDGKAYHVVCKGNAWTRAEFLNMINNCVQGMPDGDVKGFVEVANRYCERNNLPFF